ncbi:MAG: ABC transporter ATP-binding protein [Planctomycetota bacterium]
MAHGDILIEAKNVERAYKTGDTVVYALKGIDLSIKQGEYVSLMGPSGSGKTTFFNMVGALDFPTAGEVLLGGRNLQDLSPAELAYLRCVNIGYIFQNYNLIEVFTALDNVMLPMRLLGIEEDKAQQRAKDILTRVGLGKRFDHLPGELSGGQQQRVAIARSLANSPSLILADEPTGNLDHRMLDVSDRVVYLRSGAVERIVSRKDLQISIGSVD